MAELSVNFNRLDNVIDSLRDAESYYNDRIDHLTDCRDDINGITNEFGYLSSASFQLSQKISQLEDDLADITTFRQRVEDFRDTANDEESGLASRLYEDSNDFMHDMGITPEYEKSALERFAEGFIEGVTAIYDAIVDFSASVVEWFEEHPIVAQILVVVGEALVAIAAIAVFVCTLPASGVLAVLAAIGAGWAAFKACTDLACDAAALGAYIAGDEETGDAFADYTTRDLFHDAGELVGDGLNDITGADFFDDAFGLVGDITYTGMDIVGIVGAIVNPAEFTSFDAAMIGMQGIGKTISDIPGSGIAAGGNLINAGIDIALGGLSTNSNSTVSTVASELQHLKDYTTGLPDIFDDVAFGMNNIGIISDSTYGDFHDACDTVSNFFGFKSVELNAALFTGIAISPIVVPTVAVPSIAPILISIH